ncbi:hypothetical protein VCR17J2_200003 [Vibrio coralliirubri]|nr:hypothetical protein VCR17J2_200003 [Vibrio coralliirubri]
MAQKFIRLNILCKKQYMIIPKSDHQIDLECIEIIVISMYKLMETSLYVTPYSIRVFHGIALTISPTPRTRLRTYQFTINNEPMKNL